MASEIRLEVKGTPRAAGRPRFARIGNGVRTYPDPRDEPAKQAIVAEWTRQGRPKLDGPWNASISATFPRPPSHWNKSGLSAAGRRSVAPQPDVDNVAKIVLDCLVKAGAVSDDRHCLGLLVTKRWAADRESEGLVDVSLTAA